MARPGQAQFVDKIHAVRLAVDVARGETRHHFDFSGEVAPGVRLVLSEVGGLPLVFSLWQRPADIAEICSDAAVPATDALLAIDADQARAATAAGHTVDLAQLTRSESFPGVYYALFDHASPRQLHSALHRLVPGLEIDDAAV